MSQLTRQAIESHLGGPRRRLLAAGSFRSGFSDTAERIEEILAQEIPGHIERERPV